LSVGFVMAGVLSVAVHAATEPRIAVLEFDVQKGITIDRIYFSDKVRSVLGEHVRSVFLMDRQSTEMILNQSGKSLEDCTSNCEVETGRLLGADYVVSGRITRLAKTWYLTIRLHATKDGRFLASTEASGMTEPELAAKVSDAVGRLVEALSIPLRSNGAATVAVGPIPPVPLGKDAPIGELDIAVRANYETALASEKLAEWEPKEAGKAWKALADTQGHNPYRTEAARRADAWTTYAAKRSDFLERRYSDEQSIAKIIWNNSVAAATKLEALQAFQSKYGTLFSCQPDHRDLDRMIAGDKDPEVAQCKALTQRLPHGYLSVLTNEPHVYTDHSVSVDGELVGFTHDGRALIPISPGRHYITVDHSVRTVYREVITARENGTSYVSLSEP
jgi:TolB-like protein